MPGIRSASGEARQPVPASTGGALIVPGGPLSGDADTGLNLPDAQTKSLTENPDRAAEAGEVEPEDRDEAPAAVRFLTAGVSVGTAPGHLLLRLARRRHLGALSLPVIAALAGIYLAAGRRQQPVVVAGARKV
jgi:hypothetical protein